MFFLKSILSYLENYVERPTLDKPIIIANPGFENWVLELIPLEKSDPPYIDFIFSKGDKNMTARELIDLIKTLVEKGFKECGFSIWRKPNDIIAEFLCSPDAVKVYIQKPVLLRFEDIK